MKSKMSPEFRKLLQALPKDVQKQARDSYRQFKSDPYHPSLQFKKISERRKLYSVRIGKHYRALGLRINDDLVIWDWIGSHTEYEKRI
jgi:mRNA-degrading endonuclease RelE of RelBE toxin-antitoxin system